jgi:hypothetical protein
MPAAERSVYAPWDEIDDFLTCALGEVKTAIDRLSVYAARLDLQLAVEPGTDAVREMVREVRGQAELVAKIVDSASPFASGLNRAKRG